MELKDSERQSCEVWTRVMGYHRPVSSFNAGKKAEHRERVYFVDPAEGKTMSTTEVQKFKVLNTTTGSEVFFCDHAFKPALLYAQEYIERNSDQQLELYALNKKPKPAPRWLLLKGDN